MLFPKHTGKCYLFNVSTLDLPPVQIHPNQSKHQYPRQNLLSKRLVQYRIGDLSESLEHGLDLL